MAVKELAYWANGLIGLQHYINEIAEVFDIMKDGKNLLYAFLFLSRVVYTVVTADAGQYWYKYKLFAYANES